MENAGIYKISEVKKYGEDLQIHPIDMTNIWKSLRGSDKQPLSREEFMIFLHVIDLLKNSSLYRVPDKVEQEVIDQVRSFEVGSSPREEATVEMRRKKPDQNSVEIPLVLLAKILQENEDLKKYTNMLEAKITEANKKEIKELKLQKEAFAQIIKNLKDSKSKFESLIKIMKNDLKITIPNKLLELKRQIREKLEESKVVGKVSALEFEEIKQQFEGLEAKLKKIHSSMEETMTQVRVEEDAPGVSRLGEREQAQKNPFSEKSQKKLKFDEDDDKHTKRDEKRNESRAMDREESNESDSSDQSESEKSKKTNWMESHSSKSSNNLDDDIKNDFLITQEGPEDKESEKKEEQTVFGNKREEIIGLAKSKKCESYQSDDDENDPFVDD